MSEGLALTDQYRKAQFGTAIEIAAASVGTGFTKQGTLNHNACIVVIYSNLDQPVWLSFGSGNQELVVPAGGLFTLDLKASHMAMAKNTPILIKRVTVSPTTGNLFFSYVGV